MGEGKLHFDSKSMDVKKILEYYTEVTLHCVVDKMNFEPQQSSLCIFL